MVKTLDVLITENEDWLVDRVVSYAVEQGFTRYTSTLREAWRASICGLSGPILENIAAVERGAAGIGGCGIDSEKAISFGVEQAIRHRARGLRLTDFLGLLKYYRRAYLDLIDENPLPPDNARRMRGCILDFFDQVEIGLCREWTATSDLERLRDLQKKNRSLTNEKNKYLTIFESIREPVILLDEMHRPIHLNQAAHRLFVGNVAPGATYYGALKSQLLNEQIAAILGNAGTGSYDRTVETLSGRREFNVHIQEMLDISEKFDGTVIILNDVSEYKRALRRAEAADHAKSTFLAAMSHEIRTPIAGVLGLARLLRDTPLSAEQAGHVDRIVSSGELLAGVVGDILDFSQAEVGGRSPVPEDFDLSRLLKQVLLVVERLAVEKDLQLETRIDPGLPARLRGDTSMIRQVLLNLVHNAIKFTDAGGVTIRVAPLNAGRAGDGWVRFEVIDSGVGLPEGPSDWLFDAFTQHDRRRDALKGGVGLGLAICRKIVASMGGEIGCHPNAAGGSCFYVDLPLEDARSKERDRAAPPSPAGICARVLVVDDDEVNLAVATGFLEKLGHSSLAVSSATDAIQCLRSDPFDLVLTDNRMPGITGRELVTRIRGLTAGPNTGIPIVIVSASVGDLREEIPGSARPDGVLAKPYDTDDLARAIFPLLPERPVPDLALEAAEEPARAEDAEFAVLRQHIEHLGPERGRQIIRAFAETAPARLEALRRGVAGRNRQEVSDAAHALAGASGLLGLTTIAAWSRDIETRSLQDDGIPRPEEARRLERKVLELREKLLDLVS